MGQLVSVVVPAFNEADSLPELYRRVKSAMDGKRIDFEFIAIDDGSTDDTFKVLKEMAAEHSNIVVLKHSKNHGKSMALMQGFQAAEGDVAVMMDADLQDHPEAIPKLLGGIVSGHDLVNGWRKDRMDKKSKILCSELFNYLIKRLFGFEVKDVNCGFKAMRRDVYKSLKLQGDLHRLIPVIARMNGFRCTEVPVPHSKRVHGRSRYKLLRHRGILDIIILISSTTTRIRPFHVFSEMGLALLFLAALTLGAWTFLSLPPAASKLLALSGCWLLLSGTMLPLLGYLMDFMSGELQTGQWRQSLVRERIDNRKDRCTRDIKDRKNFTLRPIASALGTDSPIPLCAAAKKASLDA